MCGRLSARKTIHTVAGCYGTDPGVNQIISPDAGAVSLTEPFLDPRNTLTF